MFFHIFQSSPIAITLTNLSQGVYVDVNPAAEKLFGYGRDDLLAQHFDDWESALEPQVRDRLLMLLSEQGRIEGFACKIFTRTGEFRDCLLYIESLRIDGIAYALSQIVDVSTQYQAIHALRDVEQRLQQHEETYRLLFATMVQGVVFQDAQGQVIDANPAAERILGVTLDQLRGRTSHDLRWKAIHEDGSEFRGETHPAMVALRTGQPVCDVLMGIYNPETSSYRWININAVPRIHPGDSTPYQVYTTFDDVTVRKEAAEEIRQVRDLFALLFHSSPIPTALAILPDWRLLDVNKAMETLVGYQRQELIGQVVDNFSIPIDAEVQVKLIELLATHGHISGYEIMIQTRLGATKACALYIETLKLQGKTYTLVQMVDISAQKQTEQALREAETNYRTLVEQSPVVVYVLENSTEWRYLSPQIERVLGYSAEDYRMDPGLWLKSIHTEDIARIRHELQRMAQVGDKFCLEYRMITRDGRQIWVYSEAEVVPDPVNAGQVLHGVFYDITERKEIEKLLHQWADAFEHCAHGIAIGLPAINHILTCNPAFARLQGRTISEVVSMPILSMYAPEDHVHVGQCMAEADRVGSVRYEASMVRKDGSQYPVQMDVVSVRDQSGTLMYRVATQQDITQRKQAEAAFVESERRFRVLIENAPGAITLIGVDGRLTYVSSSTQRVMGYRPEDAIGLDPVGFIHPDDLPELLVVLNDLIQHPGKVVIAYYRFQHQDGSWRWVESTISNLLHEPSVQGIAFNFQDITARKQAETALHRSEEQYRGLMKSLDNVIAIVDVDGYFLYMNGIAAQQLGGKPEDFIGCTMHELFPEPIATRQLARIQIAIRDDQGLIAEAQSALQGQLRWYRTSIQPIHDDLGQVRAALVNSTDIHDLKTAQHDLLELNRTLEERVQQRTVEVVDLYEHAPIGYHSLDVVGNLIMINQTELKWMGYTREAMLGRPLTDFITPRSQVTFQEYFPILIQRGWLKDIEIDFIRKDGTILPGLVSATAIYDQAGVYVMSRSTVFDNTERKQAEDALRESEAQNRLLFEESPDAVVLFDQIGVMVRVNRAFERMMGYPAERLIGTTLDALGLISSEQSALLIPKAIQTVQTYADFSVVSIEITRADGESRHLGVRLFALYIQGRPHMLATMRDITLEKHAEETLRMANAELARAARAKDEFLANMSHELRTPINAILAFSESLQEAIYGSLTDRQREAIDNIEIGGRHLLTLINDILDLAKVEAERLDLQIEPISLESVCHSSLMFVKEQALKKDLLLEFRLNDRLSMLEADGKRLKQMLVNLLSNAVKFTPAGGTVCLDVNIDLDAGMVRFVVQDTGIGIAPDDLSRLFQPFNQIDSGLSRQHEGTGLGLVLVRRLAELHGGSVAVESTVGAGSRFTITLPYRLPTISATVAPLPVLAPPTDIHVEATAPGVVRARVLLAEDNEANLMAIGEYLRVMGCLVFIARNGYEVLARLDEVQPDVILMDIQMPEMDGLETMRRLRAMTEYATIPILVLTALAMPGDRERCMAAGANAYMTKPVSLRVLMETIQQLISV